MGIGEVKLVEEQAPTSSAEDAPESSTQAPPEENVIPEAEQEDPDQQRLQNFSGLPCLFFIVSILL
jgi:hypothetical protein